MGNGNDPSTRVRITQQGGRIAVRIAAPRSLTMIAFLAFWMVGWAGGEVAVIRTLTSGGIRASAYGFVALWLLLWTAGGLAGVLGLLWSFAGHEIVAVEGGFLSLRRAAGPVGRTQTFPLSEVSKLRYLPPAARGAKRADRVGPGALAFDHRSRTVQFGTYLEPRDGQKVLDALSPALPAAAANARSAE